MAARLGWVTRDSIAALNITRVDVHKALMVTLQRRWLLAYGNTVDPRQGGPSLQLRIHLFWVHDSVDRVILARDNVPKYMKLCLPTKQLQCLTRYRLASLHLEGRKNHNRHTLHRACPLCGVSGCRTAWTHSEC